MHLAALHTSSQIQLNKEGNLKHFLTIEGLSKETLTKILDTAASCPASRGWRRATARRRTRYPAYRGPASSRRRTSGTCPAPRRRRPSLRTRRSSRRECGVPTKADVKCTSPACFPSSGNNFWRNAREQI